MRFLVEFFLGSGDHLEIVLLVVGAALASVAVALFGG